MSRTSYVERVGWIKLSFSATKSTPTRHERLVINKSGCAVWGHYGFLLFFPIGSAIASRSIVRLSHLFMQVEIGLTTALIALTSRVSKSYF